MGNGREGNLPQRSCALDLSVLSQLSQPGLSQLSQPGECARVYMCVRAGERGACARWQGGMMSVFGFEGVAHPELTQPVEESTMISLLR